MGGLQKYSPKNRRSLIVSLKLSAAQTMSGYATEYAHILNPLPLHASPDLLSTNAEFLDSIPAAPLMVSAPLPSSALSTLAQSTDMDFYPLNILSHLPLSKEKRLQETVLFTPIHIHTPYAHIGTIHTSFPGQRVNAWDLILYLKSLAQLPLSSHETHVYLTQRMMDKVQATFDHRSEQLSSIQATTNWEELISEGATLHEPIGEDLFLGKTNVWGLEQRSIQGHSVIHLA